MKTVPVSCTGSSAKWSVNTYMEDGLYKDCSSCSIEVIYVREFALIQQVTSLEGGGLMFIFTKVKHFTSLTTSFNLKEELTGYLK